jgi:hypothetical protein
MKMPAKFAMEEQEEENNATLLPVRVAPGKVRVRISIALDQGYKYNEEAPDYLQIKSSNNVLKMEGAQESKFDKPLFPLEVDFTAKEGQGKLKIDYVIYYCRTIRESICLFDDAHIIIPVKVEKNAPRNVIEVKIKNKAI